MKPNVDDYGDHNKGDNEDGPFDGPPHLVQSNLVVPHDFQTNIPRYIPWSAQCRIPCPFLLILPLLLLLNNPHIIPLPSLLPSSIYSVMVLVWRVFIGLPWRKHGGGGVWQKPHLMRRLQVKVVVTVIFIDVILPSQISVVGVNQ